MKTWKPYWMDVLLFFSVLGRLERFVKGRERKQKHTKVFMMFKDYNLSSNDAISIPFQSELCHLCTEIYSMSYLPKNKQTRKSTQYK